MAPGAGACCHERRRSALTRANPERLRSSEQSAQNGNQKEDLDADDEEDSRFMKLAKKVTAKTLQRKGRSGDVQGESVVSTAAV